MFVSLVSVAALALRASIKPVAQIQVVARGAVPDEDLRRFLAETKREADIVAERELKLGTEVRYVIRRERLGHDEIPHTRVSLWWF